MSGLFLLVICFEFFSVAIGRPITVNMLKSVIIVNTPYFNYCIIKIAIGRLRTTKFEYF